MKYHDFPGTVNDYKRVHKNVNKKRGKASSCAWGCVASRYEWANLTGDYENVDDYAAMCCRCHARFDYAKRETELGITRFRSYEPPSEETRQLISAAQLGIPKTATQRQKMSEARTAWHDRRTQAGEPLLTPRDERGRFRSRGTGKPGMI